MTWAMLSTSPLCTTTFSDTGVNLLRGTAVCRLCGGGRMPFTFGTSVQHHVTGREGDSCKGSHPLVKTSAQQVL